MDVPLSPLSVSKESNSDDELLPATYDLRNTELKCKHCVHTYIHDKYS